MSVAHLSGRVVADLLAFLKIVELGEEVERKQAKFDELGSNIQKHLDRWLPRLNELIAQISERFTAALEREWLLGVIVA